MKATAPQSMQTALYVRLARRKIRDLFLEKVTHRIAKSGLKVGRAGFCPFGICIDYYFDSKISVDGPISHNKYRAVKLFPYGILVDDLFRLQVEMHVPELAKHGLHG